MIDLNKLEELAPSATIDGPKFSDLLAAWGNADEGDDALAAADALIAHIDAHVAQAVARALEAQAARVLHLTHERDMALRAARAPAAQQGDGELPALPSFPAGYRRKSDYDPIGGLPLFTTDQMRDYGRLCLAVRQPAPVGEFVAQTFEQWAKSAFFDVRKKPDGEYASQVTRYALQAWDAACREGFNEGAKMVEGIIGERDAARAALAQRAGSMEPYGWAYECVQPGTDGKGWAQFLNRERPNPAQGVRNIIALYASPPPQLDSERAGTPSARLNWMLAELAKVFPEVEDKYGAAPPELAYFEAMVRLKSQQPASELLRLAEEALLKNGFTRLDDCWVAPSKPDSERDAARLDWLEQMANEPEGLLLHDGGDFTGRRGLGLRRIGRTLRQAIDAAMAAHHNETGGAK